MRTDPRSAERSGKPASRSCILPFGPATPTVTPFVLTLSLKMSSASAIFPAQPLGEPSSCRVHYRLGQSCLPPQETLLQDAGGSPPTFAQCYSAAVPLSRNCAARSLPRGHPRGGPCAWVIRLHRMRCPGLAAPAAAGPEPGGATGRAVLLAGRCYWPGGARGGPGGAGRCYWPASSRQVRPLRTLAGRSATMSEPGRAAPSRTLTRIQRRSPVRVSA
jgi:hypothetical protein